MELKKGEVLVKKGGVSSDWPGTSSFGNLWGTLGMAYLTNQRLVFEYYVPGIPILCLFTGPPKKEIEILLTDITDVCISPDGQGLFGNFRVTLECRQAGKPKSYDFFVRDPKDSRFATEPALARNADDWVAQIRRMANLPAK
jgi:hypothetical protein